MLARIRKKYKELSLRHLVDFENVQRGKNANSAKVYSKHGFYRLQQAEKPSSSNWIFQTGELQKSSADR